MLFCKYFILFLVYSFFGWIIEMVFCSIYDKKVVNRGFLIGPYCPIYGCGCILILSLLFRYKEDPFTLMVMAILICSILEYFTSYIMEKLFNARWWDYSNKRFNINGRICLETLIAFGVLALGLVYVVNPFFISCLENINNIVLICISIFLLVIFIVDMGISFKIISGFKNVANSVPKDNTEEITIRVKELLSKRNWLYKRLIEAFNFKVSERLLKKIHKIAMKSTAEAIKVINDSAEVAKKTIEETKNKISRKSK